MPQTRRLRRGLRSTYKRGGDITREQFESHNRKLGPYFSYASVVKNYLIPAVNLMGSKCDANKTDIRLLFAGANGFALQFSCRSGAYYTAKLKYELNQTLTGELPKDIKNAYKQSIEAEFLGITRFNSVHIMKALKYFYFNPEMKKIFAKNTEGQQVIEIRDDLGGNYKFKPEDAEAEIIPFFGGIILEAVKFRIVEAPAKIAVVKTLFKHYVKGLTVINGAGYIHNDIKPDNLMYNTATTPTGIINYYGKIIDLGEVYNAAAAGNMRGVEYVPASREYAPENDIQRLQALTARGGSPGAKKEIAAITERYDLYCLAKSFLAIFPEVIGTDKAFTALLAKCIKEDHSERKSAKEVLAELGN